jgi:hypothetical protein
MEVFIRSPTSSPVPAEPWPNDGNSPAILCPVTSGRAGTSGTVVTALAHVTIPEPDVGFTADTVRITYQRRALSTMRSGSGIAGPNAAHTIADVLIEPTEH